jgi:hypothetical protein
MWFFFSRAGLPARMLFGHMKLRTPYLRGMHQVLTALRKTKSGADVMAPRKIRKNSISNAKKEN